MIDLNDNQAIAQIDKADTYSSVSSLAKQCKQAWDETQVLRFPDAYKNVQNIALCGMGGSAYAAYFIKALFANLIRVPFTLANGYNLPGYIDQNSLVLLSSYSGSTEEILSCAQEAVKRSAKIAAVTSGSKLAEFTKANNFPAYIFNPQYNLSQQPRLGQGYMILGHMGVLARLGFIPLTTEDVSSAVSFLESENAKIEKEAKKIAQKLMEKIPVIVASEHLSGNAHTMRNQFNETAKNFAAYAIIPELNHHLMEGLIHPTERILSFLILNSMLYSPIIQKRNALTREVITKNNIEVIDIQVEGQTQLAQILYCLALGGYITFYLAILYGQDPNAVPWVDYFKEQLA
ncbi:MAG: SIS domain-containing protein [Candidatus Levybacteria bacterium]|nr:SIS domain-containing protein [Candidatus Levybacteria bacterium]